MTAVTILLCLLSLQIKAQQEPVYCPNNRKDPRILGSNYGDYVINFVSSDGTIELVLGGYTTDTRHLHWNIQKIGFVTFYTEYLSYYQNL